MAAAFAFFDPVDRLHVAAAVARLGVFHFAFEEAHHGVGFVRFPGGFGHRHRAEFPRHGEVDRADLVPGAKTAAGGHERCSEEQRDRDRRAAARHQLAAGAGHFEAKQTGSCAEGMALPIAALISVGSVSVTITMPLASVGPVAPVTVAPFIGLCCPFSS